jgi:hypothetical protein
LAAGTLGTFVGLDVNAIVAGGAGVITTSRGIHVGGVSFPTGTSPTTHDGIIVDDQCAGGFPATTCTGIHVAAQSNAAFSAVFDGPVKSTIATGTAPLTIASVTPVANLTLSTAAQVPAINVGASGNGGITGTLAKVNNPIGIYNFNQSAQSQVVVSATEYYITRSDLDMPAAYTTAIGAGTTMKWRIALNKTAAGTGTFQILLKKGTNGSIADTSIVTQTIGTQTAAADNMEADIQLVWTSATAAYWTIIPRQSAATGTGFGLVYPAVAAQFNGTISGQTTTTASDKYGLSVIFTTGTPTFIVDLVQAQAFGVN